ncbi:MAG: HU family DNA-binding protein [Syntrophomonadaceae bacterium]
MNKTDLIGDVAAATGMTKKDAEKIINAFIASVQEALKAGEKVQLIGFGTFEVRDRQARKGRNPQTGKEIKIAAARIPAFKVGKGFKEAIL